MQANGGWQAEFNKQIGKQYIACPKELSVEDDRIVLPLMGWWKTAAGKRGRKRMRVAVVEYSVGTQP